MKFFDRFKPVDKKETKKSVFDAGSGPEDESEKFSSSEVAGNFAQGLTKEDKETPLVTDNYQEETAAAVEDVREKIAENDKEVKAA